MARTIRIDPAAGMMVCRAAGALGVAMMLAGLVLGTRTTSAQGAAVVRAPLPAWPPAEGARAALRPVADAASAAGRAVPRPAPAPMTVPAPAPPSGARGARPTLGCLIGPERVADIGSPVVGIVAAVPVDLGDTVQAGQPLVVLRSDVEQAGLEAAQVRSSIDADIHAAQANASLARQRVARAEELLAEGFVSSQAVEQARAERDVADQKLEQARGQKQVNEQELRIVQAQVGQRTVRSPFRGVVVERHVNTGERVEERPMLRVAMLDPLRVELVLPATRWGSVAAGAMLAVTPELPGSEPVSARVTHVDRVIDAASNTFRVRLALPNPGHRLPAGARCRIDESAWSAVSAPARPVAPGPRPNL